MPEQKTGDISLQMIRTMEQLSVHTGHILERLKTINGSVGDHERELNDVAKDVISLKGEIKNLQDTVASTTANLAKEMANSSGNLSRELAIASTNFHKDIGDLKKDVNNLKQEFESLKKTTQDLDKKASKGEGALSVVLKVIVGIGFLITTGVAIAAFFK